MHAAPSSLFMECCLNEHPVMVGKVTEHTVLGNIKTQTVLCCPKIFKFPGYTFYKVQLNTATSVFSWTSYN